MPGFLPTPSWTLAHAGAVQQRHAGHAELTGLQGQGYQLVHGQAVIQRGGQGPLEEGVHFFVILQQGVGVLGVGGQALETVGDQLPQRADILVLGGQDTHGLGLLLPVAGAVPHSGLGQVCSIVQLGEQPFLGVQRGLDARHNALLVKIGIGNGGEQVQGDQMVDLVGHILALGAQLGGHGRQPLGHVHQQILHSRHVGLLAADARHGAALASGGLLTLITKHFMFHDDFLLICLWFGFVGAGRP